MCWIEVPTAVAWACGVVLVFRVSAFRVDRPGGGYFGLPYFSNMKYFSTLNFRPEGRRYLVLLWVATALFGIGAFSAVYLCV